MDKDQQLLAHFFVRLFSLPVSVPDYGRAAVSEDGFMTQQPLGSVLGGSPVHFAQDVG